MIGSILGGVAGLVGGLANMGMQAANYSYNQTNQNRNKNWSFADSRVANNMMSYYLTHGSLDGYKPGLPQDYDDVADYLNPFLQLNSLQMQQKAQKMAEEQFKYSKYVTENGAQIKVNDLKKAGLSPLLASGNSSSFSPVSVAGGNLGSVQKSRPNNVPLSAPGLDLSSVSNLMQTVANVKNINADTELKKAQTNSETLKPELILTGIEKDKADIELIQENAKLIKQKVVSEIAHGELTRSQIDYYSEQISTMQWNLAMAVRRGVSTTDNMSSVVKLVKDIVSTMGVDINSSIGNTLVSAGVMLGATVAGYMATKGVVKKGGSIAAKYGKKIYNKFKGKPKPNIDDVPPPALPFN